MASNFIPKDFSQFLVETNAVFASLPLRVQIGMAQILYRALAGQRQHNSDIPGLFNIFWQSKQADFKSAAVFNQANEKLNWFTQEIGAKIGSHARGYKLTPNARATGAAYLAESLHLGGMSNYTSQPETKCSSKSGLEDAKQKLFRMPANAIRSKTSTGANTRFKGISLSPAVEIDTEAVRELYHAMTSVPVPNGGSFKRKTAYERGQRTATQALMLLDIASRFGAGNIVPCTYTEIGCGRLYGEGHLTLQGCTRELRKAALKGCYDLDIENCHVTLLSQMASREGIETPHLQSYLDEKVTIRKCLANDLGVSTDDAKFIIVSLVYGARFAKSSVFNRSEIELRIGRKPFRKALKNEFLLGLHEDIKAARQAVLASRKATSNKTGYIINDAGRQLTVNDTTPAVRLAHILQGAESEILRVCLGSLSSIVVIQHDGFTSREKIDVALLSQQVKEQTGYDVGFSQEQL